MPFQCRKIKGSMLSEGFGPFLAECSTMTVNNVPKIEENLSGFSAENIFCLSRPLKTKRVPLLRVVQTFFFWPTTISCADYDPHSARCGESITLSKVSPPNIISRPQSSVPSAPEGLPDSLLNP
jgi:hypothetical protein